MVTLHGTVRLWSENSLTMVTLQGTVRHGNTSGYSQSMVTLLGTVYGNISVYGNTSGYSQTIVTLQGKSMVTLQGSSL